MCQATEDDLSEVLSSKLDLKKFRKCLKCDKNSVVVTRISEALCKECFMEYFTHKFRSTIGKHKIIKNDETVLFAYSASGSCVAMLNLLAKGCTSGEEIHLKKRFTFKPSLLFVEDHKLFETGCDNLARKEFIQKVLNLVEYSKFDVYFTLIENSIDEDTEHEGRAYFSKTCDLKFDDLKRDNFLEMLKNTQTDTSREEIIKRLRAKLINRISNELGIKKVLFGLNQSKLAVELLSNVAMGKGAHIATEMALEETHNNLIFIRPLREVTSKEIAFYNHFSNLDDSIISSNSSLKNLPNSTIYRLTEKFINGVQNNFPTTVSTIFRTSDKLVPFEDETSVQVKAFCSFCECTIDTNNNTGLASSAISDLNFSKSISKLDKTSRDTTDNYFDSSKLCYSCGITLGDIKDKANLPKSLRQQMKLEIQEFLIEA